MTERYGVPVTGVCRICRSEGYTEMHHIISQAKIKKLCRDDLLTNPGNIVELCRECHDLTDSSSYRDWIEEKDRRLRCMAQVRKKKGNRQCRAKVQRGHLTCYLHRGQREKLAQKLDEAEAQSE